MWSIPRTPLIILLLLSLTCASSEADGANPYIMAITMSENSSEVIADALQSAVEWVDRIVLLNTGITDKTMNIAKKTAGSKLIIKNMTWPGSFADARNKALQIAAALGGSWGVFLDTDERLAGDTSTIREFLQTTTADMVHMKHESLTYQKVRSTRVLQRQLPAGQTAAGAACVCVLVVTVQT